MWGLFISYVTAILRMIPAREFQLSGCDREKCTTQLSFRKGIQKCSFMFYHKSWNLYIFETLDVQPVLLDTDSVVATVSVYDAR